MKLGTRLSLSATAMTMTALLLDSNARAQELVQSGQVETSERARVPARTGDFSLKIEPGVAFPLSRPQSQRFEVGGSQTVKGLWALTPYLDLGPSISVLVLPAKAPLSDTGTAWTFGGGARLKRAHHGAGGSFDAISPWLDADLLYVRTDQLNRPGFAAAAGLSVPLGESRTYWIGPFVRYLHIFQGTRSGFDDNDAKILSLGISLEMGSGIDRERAELIPATVAPAPTIKEVLVCPDRDRDGVPDTVDRCPDVVGTSDGWGCPNYQKIVVKPGKLELKEKLYFAWDQATLQDVSFPVLDEVVQALKDNKGFHVQVEGHTSSEGANDHNQTLSEKRAGAVLDYLVAHGVEKDRLGSKGFAATVPIDSNETSAGRENNRRVEFVVNFVIVDGGSK